MVLARKLKYMDSQIHKLCPEKKNKNWWRCIFWNQIDQNVNKAPFQGLKSTPGDLQGSVVSSSSTKHTSAFEYDFFPSWSVVKEYDNS